MRRKIPLPRAWNRRTKAAILQILALSHYAFTAMVARAANDRHRRTWLQAEIDRLNHELALLQEEIRTCFSYRFRNRSISSSAREISSSSL